MLGMLEAEDLECCPAIRREGADSSGGIRVSGLKVASKFSPQHQPDPNEVFKKRASWRAEGPMMVALRVTLVGESQFQCLEVCGIQEWTQCFRDGSASAKGSEVRWPNSRHVPFSR